MAGVKPVIYVFDRFLKYFPFCVLTASLINDICNEIDLINI